MKALSIRQPWATLIVQFGKDIENRCWATRFRGPVLIHAAKGMTVDEWIDAIDFARPMLEKLPTEQLALAKEALRRDSLPRGGIIGSAEIIDCVRASSSPWFMGEHGFLLRDAKPLPFQPFKGALGFFDVPNIQLATPADAAQSLLL